MSYIYILVAFLISAKIYFKTIFSIFICGTIQRNLYDNISCYATLLQITKSDSNKFVLIGRSSRCVITGDYGEQ